MSGETGGNLSPDEVLAAVRERSGATAQQLAHALGHRTPRQVVPILNRLRIERRVERFERDRSPDVARWRVAA